MKGDEALIRQVAAALATEYRVLDLAGAAGLLLNTYYDGGDAGQLAPGVLRLQVSELAPDVDRDGYQMELGSPEVEKNPQIWTLCEQLHSRIEHAEDGYVLIDTYFVALADALHHELGIPVLAPETETPVTEQLQRQLGQTRPDPLADFEVAVSWPINPHRVAAVWRSERGFEASARAPFEPIEILLNTEIGRDPEVRAGWLPPGAVGAAVQDRNGTWHDARASEQVWLCVLPQRAGQKEPTASYREAEGTLYEPFTHNAGLPALWPSQAPGPPELSQSSDEVLAYSADDWYLVVLGYAGVETGSVFRSMPGTILGRPHAFGLQTIGNRWRAVALGASTTIEIEADGRPPKRLDLLAIDQAS